MFSPTVLQSVPPGMREYVLRNLPEDEIVFCAGRAMGFDRESMIARLLILAAHFDARSAGN